MGIHLTWCVQIFVFVTLRLSPNPLHRRYKHYDFILLRMFSTFFLHAENFSIPTHHRFLLDPGFTLLALEGSGWIEAIMCLPCDFLFLGVCFEWSSKPQLFLQGLLLLIFCRKCWKFRLVAFSLCYLHCLPSTQLLVTAVRCDLPQELEFLAGTPAIQEHRVPRL